ncbi:DUF4190 domain-containing protein [Streptomyces sp. NBC_01255]|uniref:DUF4190 domain-containing protein n=1 Tax=Streptomyces sp. NBC_01255 TaxID=2903798 RepID=UPI002E323E85|nr:DUF4190 domain-containing protein [Streptomyces sp. NBC_01255]
MSDNRDQPQGGYDPADPWAPPNRDGVELSKPVTPSTPPVHDQMTVTSMPAASDVPPPPVAPGGPAAAPGYGYPAATPPAGAYGYPAANTSGGAYGYPAAPTPPAAPGYAYPGYGQPGWQQPQNNGMAIASMVLGICGVVLAFCSYGILGLILGGVALPLGIVARKRFLRGEAGNKGQAVAGIALGSIGIALGLAGIGLIIYIATHADEWSDSGDDPWSSTGTFLSAPR